MEAWIFMPEPLERWMADYRRTFDAWEAGGVRGLSFGYLWFRTADGARIPIFDPDPRVYAAFGVSPPPPAPRDLQKEKLLHAMLDDAAGRGWHLMTFTVGGGGGSRPLEEDPYGSVGYAAAVQDTMNAFPQVHGFIIDGPGEQHYELEFHHGREWLEIDPRDQPRLAALGFSLDRLQRGIDQLRERLHQLTPARVRYLAPGGTLAGMNLLDLTEDSLYWLRARRQTALGSMAATHEQVQRLNRRIEMGGIPRTAALSSLTGQDYERMGEYFDFVLPKHYYWHRGFDGLYGTVARWVQRLLRWNPSLTEADGLAVVRSLFGIDLPGVESLLDLELGFSEEFFARVVQGQARMALEAVGDPAQVIFWVSTGRAPHAGDAMTARDLHGILTASRQAGAQRYLFHPDPDLGAAEWRVLSSFSGRTWKEDPSGYWPADTPRPDAESFSGKRKPATRD
jgi:hypothetical protein